jgi:hypothetical protein
MSPPAKKVLLWIGGSGAMAATNTKIRLAAAMLDSGKCGDCVQRS